jgi:hypothetical protein
VPVPRPLHYTGVFAECQHPLVFTCHPIICGKAAQRSPLMIRH